MEEVWKDIPEFKGRYQISNLGRVKRVEGVVVAKWKGKPYTKRVREQILRNSKHQFGYPQISLYREDGTQFYSSIHAIVAMVFIGPKPDGLYVLHKDGNPENCCADNLRYGTQKENMRDKEGHGTMLRGSNVGTSKLVESQVIEIKKRLLKGESHSSIAEDFGVHQSSISLINIGRNWKHIELPKAA